MWFLSYESRSRDFFRKNSHHISVAQDEFPNFMCDIYSLYMSMTTILKSLDKVAASPVWNYGDSERMSGCLTCFKH